MRLTIFTAAAIALCASSSPAAAKKAPKPPAFELNGTTWTFMDPKQGIVEQSIDPQGKYISQTIDGKHLDHGTAVVKNGKACFTSAMTKDGEICWTTKPVNVGESMVTTSNKGQTLQETRVAYIQLSMPK